MTEISVVPAYTPMFSAHATEFDAIDLVDLQREIGSRLRLKDDAMTQEKLTLDLRIK